MRNKVRLFILLLLWSLPCRDLLSQEPSTSNQRREVGNLVIDGIPEIPLEIIERMNQYQNVRSAGFVDWNPSGPGILISTRFAETSQLHYVAMPGGARQQLTFFREPVSGGSYFPTTDRHGFTFTMDVGGGENYQLFFFDQDQGRSVLLSDGKSRNSGGLFSHDGKWVAFTSNLRNGKDFDIRRLQLDKPGVSDIVLQVEGQWFPSDWSSDDRKLLVAHAISANESYIYWLDVATKALTPINPSKKKIAYGTTQWSKDGRGVYYTSDENGEFQQLVYYDLSTAKKNVLTGNLLWDVEDFDLSRDGSKLAYLANEDGISKLRVLDLQTMWEMELPQLPVGVIYGLKFNHDGSELAMTISTSQTPGDVYSIKLATHELVRWTYSEVGGLQTANFVSPTLIHYPTFDKVGQQPRMIPAFYYRPKDASGKVPVIISIHGGPEGQSFPSFSSLNQYWLNELGIAVLVPNVRGSTGYGKTYVTLDNGFKREASVKDIGALLDWIAQQPELDKDRVGVYGGSYGGYMVLASMTHFADRLAAAVDIVGISNFVTFLENTQEYRRDLRRVEYGDERDPKMREFLNRISPATNAQRITKPLFVAQGANDPRVPASESQQIVDTVRKNGGRVWFMLAKDEGHGFQKKSNRDYSLNAMSLFWEQFLLKRNGLN